MIAMRLVLLGLLVFVCRGLCNRDRPYIDFKVVNITAGSSRTLNHILGKLNNVDDVRRDDITNSIQVIVSPEDVDTVSRVVTGERAKYEILHHNLQELVDEEFQQFDMRRKKRQVLTLENSVKKFLLLDEMYEFQHMIESQCTEFANVEKKTIGYSANNKSINVMKISKDLSAADKKTIFIEAGIHAREWLSPAAANYMIFQLACKEENSDMLDLFNWEIMSTFNPDGYEYSHTGFRFWRKNRQRNFGSSCTGTDLNRNFEAGFGQPGASASACSDTYRGTTAYSAPETKALRDYIMNNKDNIISYLAIHTYGQYILTPFGYKPDLPSDYDSLIALARRAQEAMRVPFKIGPGYDLLYATSGVSDDFAREIAGINRSYTWELMPNSRYTGGFAPKEATVPVYTPIIWRGIRAYAQAVAEELQREETTTSTPSTTAVTSTTTAATTLAEVTKPAHIVSYLWNILQTKKDEWWYPALMEQLLASKPGDVILG